MDFITSGPVLRDAVKAIMPAVNKKGLGFACDDAVLCIAEGDSVTLKSTNFEQFMRIRITADVTQPGRAVIPAAKLLRICGVFAKALPLRVVSDTSQVVLEAGKTKYELPTAAADEFPEHHSVDTIPVQLPAKGLLAAVAAVTYAASEESQYRPMLAGVNFEMKDGVFRAVATDGHRFALADQPDFAAEYTGPNFNFTIPTPAAKIVSGFFDKCEQVNVMIEDDPGNLVIFHGDEGRRLECRRVDGDYPDYRRIVPEMHAQRPIKVHVERDKFAEALERIDVLAKDVDSRRVVMQFSADGIRFLVTGNDLGSAKDIIECDYEGAEETFVVAFNAGYLLAMLKALPGRSGSTLVLGYDGPERPSTAVDTTCDWAYAVIMPLRIVE